MDVIELFHKDGRPAKVWACGACRRVARTEEDAHACCQPVHCKTCGKEVEERHWTVCRPCRAADFEAREQAKWNAAKKVHVADYDGVAVCEELEQFDDAATLFEFWDDDPDHEGLEDPRIYATRPTPLTLDAADVLEDALERQEHYEDAASDLDPKGYPLLQAYLDLWLEAHSSVVSYVPDYSVAIVRDRALVTAPEKEPKEKEDLDAARAPF